MVLTIPIFSCFALLVVACSATELSMDDPSILYSPYNWGVAGGTAKTINPGAYFRVVFSGEACVLHTNTTGSAEPFSQFWARVDGGPLQQFVLSGGSPSFNVSLGPDYATTFSTGSHMLEVIVKSTTETKARWAPQSTAVVFTGISLADGAVARAPARKKYNVLVYGDSITEGVRTLGWKNVANDTDRNDAVRDYSYQLGQALPAEVGVVAFGATGLAQGGSGGVPLLAGSWDMLWAGAPRDFAAPAPDLVVYNEGTNDGSKNVTDAFLQIVRKRELAGAAHLLLVPFNGGHKVDIQLVVAAMAGSGTTVVMGDTAGFYDGKDGLHPYGYNHMAFIAPKVAELCLPLLAKVSCSSPVQNV